jgi:5-methylcytosine-specific restriction protein B
MNVSEEFAAHDGTRLVGERLTLPWNLRIVAAMNSTDRSVAPIDAALRRRFAIINVGPDYEALAARLGIALAQELFAVPNEWTPEDVRRLALHLLISLNDRILEVLGQDFLLGHALFWHVGGADLEAVTSSLVHAFDERIVATLRLTFADQDEALGAVLGIPQGSEDRARLGYWRTPEGAMAAVATPRLVINDVSSWSETDRQLQALSSIVTG